MTGGASENPRLSRVPKSGVDVAFMQGGVAIAQEGDGLAMLASLYYEPLWIFTAMRRPAAVPVLARSLAHLSLVRRAGVAGA